jgi:hypothetical protein
MALGHLRGSTRRTRAMLAAGALLGGAIVPAVACDIFHSTDLPTLCGDASNAPGCSADAKADALVDAGVYPFTKDPQTALANAKSTCAWLAACETPMGQNQTGTCIANAVLAYDATTNPNRTPQGAARLFWQCAFDAAKLQSCDAMKSCALPAGVSKCSVSAGAFVGCAASNGANAAARVDCETNDTLPNVELCAAVGKTCGAVGNNSDALCYGPKGRACQQTGCSGPYLSVCDDAGFDQGVDCASVGARACVGSPVLTCKPEGVGSCTPSTDVWCDGGIATACPAGIPETVNCATLAGGCVDIPDASWGTAPSVACQQPSGCGADQCNGASLEACVRGKVVVVSCAAEGLGPCQGVMTRSDGSRAACSKK